MTDTQVIAGPRRRHALTRREVLRRGLEDEKLRLSRAAACEEPQASEAKQAE